MLSAFGVDHGNISKKWPNAAEAKTLKTAGKGAAAAGVLSLGAAGVTAAALRRKQKTSVSKIRLPKPPTKAPVPHVPSRAQKIKDALDRAGNAPITLKGLGRSAGRSVSGIGGAMERNSGLTGSALTGGGAAAGYSYMNKKPKKR